MSVGEKTKLLWQDPAYRKRMSEAHKWQTPPSRMGAPANSGSFKPGHRRGIGRTPSDEHRRNLSLSHRGKTPWNKGKGSLTPERKCARNDIRYKQWREAVFARDNWTCRRCHVRGGSLHPHHIKSFAIHVELRYDVNNGATLCFAHHKEFHQIYGLRQGFDEKCLIEYLTK